ncbi:Round spermatid basic protein 1-like protein [Balamuthia mandrillaris]
MAHNERQVLYVSNISPAADETQLISFFSQYGTVQQIKHLGNPAVGPTYAFIKMSSAESANAALSASDTPLLGQPLKVVLASSNDMPTLASPAVGGGGLLSSPPGGLLPFPTAAAVLPVAAAPIPAFMPSPITGVSTNAQKQDEVARTVYVGNVNSQINADQLMAYFSFCGPITYCRMAGDESHPARFAFIEFATMDGANAAMQLNGTILIDRVLKVNRSKNPIVKAPKQLDPRREARILKRLRRAVEKINARCQAIEEGKISPEDDYSPKRSRSRSSSPSSRSSSSSRSPSRERKRRRSSSSSRHRHHHRDYRDHRDRHHRSDRHHHSRSERHRSDRHESSKRSRSHREKDKDRRREDNDRDKERERSSKRRDRDSEKDGQKAREKDRERKQMEEEENGGEQMDKHQDHGEEAAEPNHH